MFNLSRPIDLEQAKRIAYAIMRHQDSFVCTQYTFPTVKFVHTRYDDMTPYTAFSLEIHIDLTGNKLELSGGGEEDWKNNGHSISFSSFDPLSPQYRSPEVQSLKNWLFSVLKDLLQQKIGEHQNESQRLGNFKQMLESHTH